MEGPLRLRGGYGRPPTLARGVWKAPYALVLGLSPGTLAMPCAISGCNVPVIVPLKTICRVAGSQAKESGRATRNRYGRPVPLVLAPVSTLPRPLPTFS